MAVKVLDFILPNWADMIDASFKWERLHDACSCVIDCPHSTPKYDEQGDYFVARTQDIRTGCFDSRNAARVNQITYEERIKRCQPIKGDILYSREGTYFGDAALIEYDNICLGQRMVLLRPEVANYDPLYVVYWLNSIFMKRHLQGLRDGTVAERLNMSTIRSLPIARPSLKTQQAIAHILGTLDDKIELNRRMNETLEAMAQALFKSWFVNFDPVKAKMEGKQPEGMDAETAALFPDKLVESELGLIPEGWEVLPLSKTIKLIGGGTPKKSVPEYWGGDIPWFSIKDMPNGSDVFITETDLLITDKGLKKSSAKLLPVGTTIISARGTVGKLGIVHKPMAMNQSCYGVVGTDVYGPYFNYYNLNSAVQTLMNNTHGAVFDTITRKTFDTYSWAFPNASLASSYEEIVEPIMQRIAQNVELNSELQQARDTLLPKLISGELEVQ